MTQPPTRLEDLADRLAEPVGQCVGEVGAARGRRDAPFLLDAVTAQTMTSAALTPGQRAALHHDTARALAGELATGELAAALYRTGILDASQRFAPNNTGYFPTFVATTVAMVLGDAERDELTLLGADTAALAVLLHERSAWALLHGWEGAIARALADAWGIMTQTPVQTTTR